jgi:hypothetical protein
LRLPAAQSHPEHTGQIAQHKRWPDKPVQEALMAPVQLLVEYLPVQEAVTYNFSASIDQVRLRMP